MLMLVAFTGACYNKLEFLVEVPLAKQAAKQPYNRLCAKCVRSCRQPVGTLLISCPRYLPRPFDIKTYRFDQLDLFGKPKKK
jgi:hypothetical protein